MRVRRVGQAVHGKTVEPVYAFDKLLIPAGTVVTGKVSAIDAVPGKRWKSTRTWLTRSTAVFSAISIGRCFLILTFSSKRV